MNLPSFSLLFALATCGCAATGPSHVAIQGAEHPCINVDYRQLRSEQAMKLGLPFAVVASLPVVVMGEAGAVGGVVVLGTAGAMGYGLGVIENAVRGDTCDARPPVETDK